MNPKNVASLFLIGFCLLSMSSCEDEFVQPEYIPQYSIEFVKNKVGDTLHLKINPNNPSPIKYWVWLADEALIEETIEGFEKIDTSLVLDSIEWSTEDIKISSSLAAVRIADSISVYFPWPKGKTYKIVQAYNGSFSHQSKFSKYAIDFNMKVGDSITAALDGYVVGVVEGHTRGGNDRRYRDYANFITIYHPEYGIYTQYVHLKKDGALVEIGEEVKANQPIGLSGKTGYTSTPHLHFNVLAANKGEDMRSIPVYFAPNINGKKLREGWRMRRTDGEDNSQ